jgi:hypothetical protein
MRWKVLPYDYARCISKDCPLEDMCMRKTPGRETYKMFSPAPSHTCKYYIDKEEDE